MKFKEHEVALWRADRLWWVRIDGVTQGYVSFFAAIAAVNEKLKFLQTMPVEALAEYDDKEAFVEADPCHYMTQAPRNYDEALGYLAECRARIQRTNDALEFTDLGGGFERLKEMQRLREENEAMRGILTRQIDEKNAVDKAIYDTKEW